MINTTAPPSCQTCPMYNGTDCRVNPPKSFRQGEKGFFPQMEPHEFCGKHPDIKAGQGSLVYELMQITEKLEMIWKAI